MKKMLFEMDEKLHYAMKQAALNRNMTMKAWLTAVIMEQLLKDKFYMGNKSDK